MTVKDKTGLLKKIDFRSPYICMSIVILVYLLKVIFKISIGSKIGSFSMQSDGFHNLTDILEGLIIIFAIYLSNRPRSKNFPMGLASIENIVSLEIGILISILGLSFFVKSLVGIFGIFDIEFAIKGLPPGWFKTSEPMVLSNDRMFIVGLVVAIVSVFLSLVISKYQINLGKSINSPGLVSDGKESLSDSLTEISVLAGVVGQILGFNYVDYIAGLFVSVFILHTGWELITNAVKVLLNVSLEKEKIEEIRKRIVRIQGVKGVDKIYAYNIGKKVTVVCEIAISEEVSFGTIHHIRAPMEREIKKIVTEIDRVYLMFTPFAQVAKRYIIGILRDRGLKSIISNDFWGSKYYVVIDTINKRITKSSIYKNKFEDVKALSKFIVDKNVQTIITKDNFMMEKNYSNEIQSEHTSALQIDELFINT